MKDNKKEKIGKAIDIVYDVLSRNKDKDGVKEAYKDIEILKEKRQKITKV